ncbi:hypothetical protein [Halotia branconii]|uniref:Uncharacterized protein n=1 Tax=Halotia branconii CENA392 TaxID=1539056 RepID=A0AAJ6P848_9CYAN|nr:hypothetical protein [Halotia branconii]WGV24241.1 hypothetical protein QI031_20940 [Halotia branconii CENA392]
MFTTVKVCRAGQKIYTKAQVINVAIALLIFLWGCSASSLNGADLTWKTYQNERYGFEFPYPSNWTALPPPTNNDGIVLVSPQSNTVEIRAWAVNRPPDAFTKDHKINSNFQTDQGISGEMLVEVNQQVSSMKLSLTQDQVKYYWQGQSQNQEFPDYYRLFYYIAQHYRIPQ